MKTEFKTSFLNTIKKINETQLKGDIMNSILNVESAGNLSQIQNLRKLKGYKHYYRIKIGHYRIGLKIESNTVFFVDIDHRKNIYRKFPK